MNKYVLTLLFIAICFSADAQKKEKLEPWKEGYLDIHNINTGKGESTFFIFPDGTSMLVDAGAAGSKKPWAADPRPNDSKEPGEWIARYIAPLLKQAGRDKIDYGIVTHFHWDHMGNITEKSPFNASGDYQLGGFTEVLDKIKVGKVIDRAWPDYNWPVPLLEDLKVANYRKFLDYKIRKEKSGVEKLRVGAYDQIKLNVAPEKYPGFQVRNIAANGIIWTGEGTASKNHIPEGTHPKEIGENGLSIALRISYGKFDYFTGGDLSVAGLETAGPWEQWKDLEPPVAMATGPVEAMKANHHANFDANSVSFLRGLRPRVIVVQSWGASQPAMSVYRRMISSKVYPGERDIFVTNIMEETKTAFDVSKLKSEQGHVVIRVYPSGQYEVLVLDDTREGYFVKERFGKYVSN